MLSSFDDLVGGVHDLDGGELNDLWEAIGNGYLITATLSPILIEIFARLCFLEARPCVILLRRGQRGWRVVVSVRDMDSLPRMVEHFVECGVFVEHRNGSCGVVSADVPDESVCRLALRLCRVGAHRISPFPSSVHAEGGRDGV